MMEEKIKTTVVADPADAARRVAREIAQLIRERQQQQQAGGGRPAAVVLGLATGSTPTAVYEHLVRMHREEGLSFAGVVSFNLDEYFPMQPDSPSSYHAYMREALLDHVDMGPGAAHIPDGSVPLHKVEEHCAEYEAAIAAAGGMDLLLLGIGANGHVGFNEPGSRLDSRTRMVALGRSTRRDAAGQFLGPEHVPRLALTMGIGTILHQARRVVLLAWGEGKARVLAQAIEGGVTAQLPASCLQLHPNAEVIADEAAAAELTRFKAPWLLAPPSSSSAAHGVVVKCYFGSDQGLMRQAAVWLSQRVHKPLLQLSEDDYLQNGLAQLLLTVQLSHTGGSAAPPASPQQSLPLLQTHSDITTTAAGGQTTSDPSSPKSLASACQQLNLEVLRALQTTITIWPFTPYKKQLQLPPSSAPLDGGSSSGEAGTWRQQVVLVFSPHPDDDVISMGATLRRLVQAGHEVHVAYMTSGSIAVRDADAWMHLSFAQEAAQAAAAQHTVTVGKGAATASSTGVGSTAGSMAAGVSWCGDLLELLERQPPGSMIQLGDTPQRRQLLAAKALIRRSEARAACRVTGVPLERAHFLDLPFYESGAIRKKPLGEEDINIVRRLLGQLRPDHIFAAGDLTDPNGTHRVCLEALEAALLQQDQEESLLAAEAASSGGAGPSAPGSSSGAARAAAQGGMAKTSPSSSHAAIEAAATTAGAGGSGQAGRNAAPFVWLYRGAWQEYALHEIDMAVPLLGPEEVEAKRRAIACHQSQKDPPPFPGADEREFWQRAQERNAALAAAYAAVGLPAFPAMEAFKRWHPAAGR